MESRLLPYLPKNERKEKKGRKEKAAYHWNNFGSFVCRLMPKKERSARTISVNLTQTFTRCYVDKSSAHYQGKQALLLIIAFDRAYIPKAQAFNHKSSMEGCSFSQGRMGDVSRSTTKECRGKAGLPPRCMGARARQRRRGLGRQACHVPIALQEVKILRQGIYRLLFINHS
jgi:hypothetical protein